MVDRQADLGLLARNLGVYIHLSSGTDYVRIKGSLMHQRSKKLTTRVHQKILMHQMSKKLATRVHQ